MTPNRAPRRLLSVLALTVAVVAFPLGALANHDFSDVPDSNPFHGDISAIADAGVTFGCGGGNYCPSANVTREQMAAFMNRLGALSVGKTPVVNAATALTADSAGDAGLLDGNDSTAFVRSDVAYPGHYNCSGATMDPLYAGFSISGGGNYMTLSAGDGDVNCPVLLPDGAVVIGFQVGVKDNSATAFIDCGLNRFPLLTESGSGTQMAHVATLPADTLGAQVLEDTTVTSATIDNSLYSYLVDCYLSEAGYANLTLAGVSIEYDFTGIPLP